MVAKEEEEENTQPLYLLLHSRNMIHLNILLSYFPDINHQPDHIPQVD
jgi:hypothetical protein